MHRDDYPGSDRPVTKETRFAPPGEQQVHRDLEEATGNALELRDALERAHRQYAVAYREHRQAHEAFAKTPDKDTEERLVQAHLDLERAAEAHQRAHEALLDAEQ